MPASTATAGIGSNVVRRADYSGKHFASHTDRTMHSRFLAANYFNYRINQGKGSRLAPSPSLIDSSTPAVAAQVVCMLEHHSTDT